MTASFHGLLDIMTALLEGGADVNKKSTSGQTCIFNAACHNQYRAIELLSSWGGSVDESTSAGVTPLMSASYRGHLECMETLLRLGADVHALTNSGQDALYNSACNGQPEAAQLLITAGSALNARENDSGWTPIMAAARNGHINVMEVLFCAGVDTEVRGVDGNNIADLCRLSNIQLNRILVGPDSQNPFADDS